MAAEWVKESLKDGCLGKLFGGGAYVYIVAWSCIPMMVFGVKDRRLLSMSASSFAIILILQSLVYIIIRFAFLSKKRSLAGAFEYIEEYMGGSLILGFVLSIISLIQRWEEVYRTEWILLLLLPVCGALFLFMREDSKSIAAEYK